MSALKFIRSFAASARYSLSSRPRRCATFPENPGIRCSLLRALAMRQACIAPICISILCRAGWYTYRSVLLFYPYKALVRSAATAAPGAVRRLTVTASWCEGEGDAATQSTKA